MGARRLTISPFWLHLDEHLLLPHHLDHLADVRARLLQQLQLLPQQAHAGVQRIALGLETAQVLIGARTGQRPSATGRCWGD